MVILCIFRLQNTTMSKKRQKEKVEKANADEETSKNTGPTPDDKDPVLTFDEYQCSGNVEIDFPGLCALLEVNDIPAVSTKQPASSTETEGGDTEDNQTQGNASYFWSKPNLQVELETEDPLSAKNLKISGWTVDEPITTVLQKMLPSLKLQSIQFWQAGLTDRMLISLMDTISLCSSLRSVTLEGNHLPEQSYHLLLSEDSFLTHLSLRNNRIGDGGAHLIGSALSTTRSSNRTLLSLNLAFNSIGDEGAAHIAQGLRFNRTLLFLSLCNNQIGDSGAARLATILCKFALTHEEVVERRKMLLERTQSARAATLIPSFVVLENRKCSLKDFHDVDETPGFRRRTRPDQEEGEEKTSVDSDQPADQLLSVASSSSLVSKGENKSKKKETPKKDKKPAANKENPKSNKKSSDVKASQSKGGKQGSKEKQVSPQEDKSSTVLNESLNEQQGESVEVGHPLLGQPENQDGELFLPGNKTLTSLNLAGNRITEKSLPVFLTSVEMQGEGGGLLRLSLQRNCFPPECECYVKIKQLMALKDPLEQQIMTEQREEERTNLQT